jgi:hypothetical protein
MLVMDALLQAYMAALRQELEQCRAEKAEQAAKVCAAT